MTNSQKKWVSLPKEEKEPEGEAKRGEKGKEHHHWRISKWFPELSKGVLEKLYIYSIELINFNERLNLISPKTERDADQLHFADSIIGGKMILEASDQKEFYCFGSGNGFPGLVMACLAPEKTFHLVDGDSRKVNFLKYVINRMGLKNCTAHQKRIEDLDFGSVRCIVSRALGNISKCLLRSYKSCVNGGEYYHFKGSSWVQEVSEIPTQICALWEPSLLGEYKLPESDYSFAIVLTKRNDQDD